MACMLDGVTVLRQELDHWIAGHLPAAAAAAAAAGCKVSGRRSLASGTWDPEPRKVKSGVRAPIASSAALAAALCDAESRDLAYLMMADGYVIVDATGVTTGPG
ncbi:hypothetical protein NPX13_g8070 [Xylaria arbuscula]|uniref:Uncharacterized protein n=1 Tax=Xylaria arbuscula TaxID=114810 RepID=A0A9W8N9N2_9PEZI|nr:hypothetical protein NPX13_g8070 [Xylaria arbuscula]